MERTTLATRHIRLNYEELSALALAMGYTESDDWTRVFNVDEDQLFEASVVLFADLDEACENYEGLTLPKADGSEVKLNHDQAKSVKKQLAQALELFD